MRSRSKNLRRVFTFLLCEPNVLHVGFVTFALICPAGFVIAAPVELTDDIPRTLFTDFSVYEDAAADLTPQEALEREYRGGFDRPPGFGMTRSAYWVRFSLENSTEHPHWLLVLKLPRLESGTLYRLERDRPVLEGRTGLVVPFASRSYPHRDMVLRIDLERGERAEYLLRIRNRVGPLVMPFRIYEEGVFVMQDQWENILLGLYFGALLVMILYNLVLFFLLKDRTFLIYSVFVTSFGTLMMLSRGLYRPYLWSPGIPFEIQAIPVTTHVALILGLVFLGSYFKMPGPPDWILRWLRYLIYALIAHFLFALIVLMAGSETYMRNSFLTLTALFPLPVFAVSLWRLRQGHSGAPYFVLGWALLIAGGFSSLLVTRGILPYNLFTYNAVLLFSVLEMMLLSLGLTDRFRALEREKERHRLASQTKTRFVAHMSHEIRTPLNAVLGMSELLRETKLSAEQDRYLSVLSRAGRNLLDVINDILDISKIEAGRLTLERIRFRPATLIESVGELFADEARARGIELTVRAEPDLPPFVEGDPTRLRQVLTNLVSNAIKFTEEGQVLVTAGPAGGGAPGSDQVRIEFAVADTGIGIALEKWELIFDAFAQADESTTRKFGGTGLGLAICRSLVELMGGRIGVESRPGEGSRFYFTIEFEVVGSSDESEVVPIASLPATGDRLRILLAEDNADNRLLFQAFLRNTGHVIDIAEDGEEAVRKFQTNTYDLAFVDIQMPVLSGLEAVERIRAWEERAIQAGARGRPVPIYALTAHALEHERRNSMEAGCDGHIAKPLEKAVLLNIVRKYTGGSGDETASID